LEKEAPSTVKGAAYALFVENALILTGIFMHINEGLDSFGEPKMMNR